jgi:SAM-dependent methyltransferase
VTGNIAFEVKAATEFDGHDFDLVCFMDCLHDLGDPVGALARCRKALKPDGKVLLVEPYAGNRLEENLNPIGRMYYAASAMACTPNSLSQEVGLGLGAQAGEERLRKVAREAGFSNLRRAAHTPVNPDPRTDPVSGDLRQHKSSAHPWRPGDARGTVR